MNETLLHDLPSEAAARDPGSTAVVDGDRSLTYGELDDLAGRMATLLRADCGVAHGDRVGIYLDKSIEAVASIYAVMRAGAVYVPLDPAAPVARLAGIAADAGIRVLITGGEKAASWQDLVDKAGIETLVAPGTDGGVEAPRGARLLTASALSGHAVLSPKAAPRSMSDLAYILYTSGSTGVPKGVMLSHLNALSFVDWAVDEFAVGSDDRLSSHAPFHFDLSVFDLFAAARAGAPVVLVPSQLALFPVELARWIDDRRITVWYSVPSILTSLVLRGNLAVNHPASLRTVLFAGEVFPTKYLAQLMDLLPGVRFANLFGPTETNVCTWYEVPRWSGEPPTSIPIGKGITGDETYAVSEDGRPVPDGEVGELWVTGPTVMQGYWGDEERTARTLELDPGGFNTFRTGDLVQRDGDGNWIFLGRRDSQIKSRGYRIELGDIEATLHLHPAVVECAVVAVPDELVTNRLKAFVVSREEVDSESLTRFCHERLPHYMVPEQFERRDELPRTSTGKVDRQTLSDTTMTGGR